MRPSTAGAALAAFFALVAIASQAWHPFALGFYHDDWEQFAWRRLFAARFGYLDVMGADRPLLSLYTRLFLDWWGGSPATLHLWKAMVNLATAAAIGVVVRDYQRVLGANSMLLSVAAAAFWLLAPWSLGYTLWPSGSFNNPAVLFLCLAAVALVRWSRTRNACTLLAASLANAAAVLYYPSVWFAAFPFLIVLAWNDRRHGPWRRDHAMAAAALLLPQVAAVSLAIGHGEHALDTATFGAGFLANLARLPGLGTGHFGLAWHAGLAAFALAAASWRLRGLWRGDAPARTQAVSAVVLAAIGLLLTCAIHASAGYAISPDGEMSRTTQMANFWMAVGAGLLFAPRDREGAAARAAWVGAALALLVVGSCLVRYSPAAMPWVRSWELQRAALAKSGELAARLAAGDAVVTDAVQRLGVAPAFAAPVDLVAALLSTHDALPPRIAQDLESVRVLPMGGDVSWRQGTLLAGGTMLPAKRLWAWSVESGRVAEVVAPAASRPELGRVLRELGREP